MLVNIKNYVNFYTDLGLEIQNILHADCTKLSIKRTQSNYICNVAYKLREQKAMICMQTCDIVETNKQCQGVKIFVINEK